MRGECFIDTNVLVYTLAQDDPRSIRAEEILVQGGKISVQVLNEFVSVARRKLGLDWASLNAAIDAILVLCPDPLPLTVSLHKHAGRIAHRYGYRFYDSLIIASALEARCTTLLSEDLSTNQLIDGRLTIRNPSSK